MITKFTEADVKTVGGLSRAERRIPGIMEMMALAVVAVPKFKEAVTAGGRGSLRRWLEAAETASRTRFREANSETTLGFLLRKGVQTLANDWYQAAEKVWPDYCGTANSTGVAEWYAPLYHTTLPAPVERGDRFPEARVIGEDSLIRNIVFGEIVGFDRVLWDDDQTGQIQQFSSKLGDGMAITESIWAAYRFLGSARTYANITVPASGYTTTDINGTAVTTPFRSTLYAASVGNRPTTFGTLNLGRLARAYVTTLNAVDPLQNKIVVRPNTLLTSAMDALRGKTLITPGPWPGVVGESDTAAASAPVLGGTVSAAGANQGVLAGTVGGWGTPNPFAGLGWKHVMERYLPDWAWALGEKGKGFLFQQRDPLEIVEEGRNTGSYFDFDQIRYRSRERFNIDWVGGGSRFWYLGDDGTVPGTL